MIIKLKFVLATLYILQISVRPTLASIPEFTIYYQDGTNITIYDSQPALSEVFQIERCDQGLWIEYNGFDYQPWLPTNTYGWVEIVYYYETYDCMPPIYADDYIRSLRPVGVLSNFNLPSATIYTVGYFGGEDYVMDSGIPNINFKIVGVITMNAEVEYFNQPDYNGESFCIKMAEDDCYEGKVCIYWDLAYYDLPFDPAEIKSARLGCSSHTTEVVAVYNKNSQPLKQVRENSNQLSRMYFSK